MSRFQFLCEQSFANWDGFGQSLVVRLCCMVAGIADRVDFSLPSCFIGTGAVLDVKMMAAKRRNTGAPVECRFGQNLDLF